MGNLESLPSNRSLRELRSEHRESFFEAIANLRQAPPPPQDVDPPLQPHPGLLTFARKRPLNARELERGEFDVVTAEGSELRVHRCLSRLDGRSLYLETKSFRFNQVFGESASNKEVSQVLWPVLEPQSGRRSVVILFGATGSGESKCIPLETPLSSSLGKTHTLLGMLEGIFERLAPGGRVGVSCMEVEGGRCSDLRTDRPLTVRESEDSTCILGLCEEPIEDPSQLAEYVTLTQSRRVSRRTGVHDHSSRTHVIYRFWVRYDEGTESSLDMVDLAGSEWAMDQRFHDAELTQHTRDINSSLSVLKRCLAARAAGIANSTMVVPFRESLLTRVLREGLSDDSSRVVAIATVAPGSEDAEHSIDTLTHVSVYDPKVEETRVDSTQESLPPAFLETKVSDWTPRQVCEWFESAAAEACAEAAHEHEMSSTGTASSSVFKIRFSAKKWVSLRLESKDTLGIVFDKEGTTLPKVKKLTLSGFAQVIRDRRLREGAMLCGIGRTTYGDHERDKLLESLKHELKQFKAAIAAYREYEMKRPRYLTEDMRTLRNYILNGASSNGGIERGDGTLEHMVEEPPLQEPDDRVLQLTFLEAPPNNASMPQCPSVFTGRNRTGLVWGGRELIEKYALPGPHRFIAACDGDIRLGTKLHRKLLSLMESQESASNMLVDEK